MDNLVDKLKVEMRVPIIYRYIHKKIINREVKRLRDIPLEEELIKRKEFILSITDLIHQPKSLDQYILEEMESCGLIEIKSQRVIKILRSAK